MHVSSLVIDLDGGAFRIVRSADDNPLDEMGSVMVSAGGCSLHFLSENPGRLALLGEALKAEAARLEAALRQKAGA
jgi:hypothetical protein